MPRVFVPFGSLAPDDRQFGNEGLQQALNAVPVHGSYSIPANWKTKSPALASQPLGLHVHTAGESTVRVYYGDAAALYDCDALNLIGTDFTITNKTRAVGGPYNTTAAGGENGWQGTSFGDAVVMTNYVDDPQLLTTPAAANFVKLAQSGGANPGMDPKAKFAFPVKGNLFLANLSLAAPLLNADGTTDLAAGTYPTHVCWSQSENIRQFGSFKATPQITGTGYQPLNYDMGHITGGASGAGGQYGLIAFQWGWVRVDGPPYTFRPIAVGSGCRQPNSIVRYEQDTYYWGPQGPMVLRGGEGPPLAIGARRVIRTLIDNRTLFNLGYSVIGVPPRVEVAGYRDVANSLVLFSYTSNGRVTVGGYSQVNNMSVVYNVDEDRFGFLENRGIGTFNANSGVRLIRSSPDLGYGLAILGIDWSPARDNVGVLVYPSGGAAAYRLAVPDYETTVNVTSLWQKCFQQFDRDMTTRILWVRPVYSRGIATSTVTFTVGVTSKNRPGDIATETTYTAADEHGRITTPASVYADFHQVKVSALCSDKNALMEMKGYEVEYATGGVSSA